MAIQVAILGFAHGHVNAYCTEWRNNPDMGVAVVAGWDHDASRLEAAANNFGFEPVYDVAGVLSRSDIQAVVISSETSMHAELVELAAHAGKAVILQKPMALTMAEADRIVSAVNLRGIPFTIAWQMRVDPQNNQMKELLQNGALGKVFMVRRRHGLPMGLQPSFAESWHVQPEFNRDIWADDSAHPIDLIHWLLGEPETVTAELESLYNPRIPNDNGIAIFRYKDGTLAEVSCSFTCTAAENTTEIICERGTIIQNFGDVPSCNVPRFPDVPGLKWYNAVDKAWTVSEIASPPEHGARIRGLAKPLAEFLHGKRPAIATAEEGRTSLRMVLACYVSDREGRRTALSDAAIGQLQ